MKYWLMPGHYNRLEEVFNNEYHVKLWGIKNSIYSDLEVGDKIIWYSSEEKSGFYALATAISDYDVNVDSKDEYPHEFYFVLDRTPLLEPINVIDIRERLSFITNKEQWWTHFQNPRKLSRDDFNVIVDYMFP